MKLKSIFIVALTAVSFLSCYKELSFENIPVSGDFRAKIDQVQWVAEKSTINASIGKGVIYLSGISKDNKQLSLTISDTIPGTYTLDQNSFSLAAFIDNNPADTFSFTTNQGSDTSQAGGEVIVSEIDKINKTITGEFRFNVYRDVDSQKKVITEGIFYKLPYISLLQPAAGVDTFNAKIDGVEVIAETIIANATSGFVFVQGSRLDGSSTIGLGMSQDIVPGTYAMSAAGGPYGLYYSPTTIMSSGGGKLIIIGNDKVSRRIRGTFEFQAVDLSGAQSAQITEGYFSVTYH